MNRTTGDPLACGEGEAVSKTTWDELNGTTSAVTTPATSTPTTTSSAPTSDEITKAFGKLVGWCLLEGQLHASNAQQREEARGELEALIQAADINPDAIDEDGNTVRQDLYDAAGHLKKCDQGLNTEAQDAISRLP